MMIAILLSQKQAFTTLLAVAATEPQIDSRFANAIASNPNNPAAYQTFQSAPLQQVKSSVVIKNNYTLV